jgi:hypothetical protein
MVSDLGRWDHHLGPRRHNFPGADLSGLDLSGVNLAGADLQQANLDGSNLTGAILERANLVQASLKGTVLQDAWLFNASLISADLTGSDLNGSCLAYANLNGTNLTDANVSDSFVFGVSVWGTRLERTKQLNLFVRGGHRLTTDNLQLAQFLYLLVDNPNLRGVLDTITSKLVLILGCFAPERKLVLDAIRVELRNRDYVPVLFDFDKPDSRDITETVSTLAHMARFVIADITDARSIPQELMAIVPNLPSVPVQPLLRASQREYGMFEHFKRYPWVLEPYLYEDQERLLAAITDKVIGPAEKELSRTR